MKQATRVLCRTASWLTAGVSTWHFLRQWFAPDACVDRGTVFDYQRWKCDSAADQLPYLEVPAYALGSFWLALLAIVAATAVHVYTKRRENAA